MVARDNTALSPWDYAATLVQEETAARVAAIGQGALSVKAFGAVGNGVADDTAAIRGAIDAAPVGGGVVYVPAGTYKITDVLTVRSGLTLAGAGMYASVIQQANVAKQAIYGADIVGFALRDLRLTGPASGTFLGSIDGVLLDQTGVIATQNVRVENVYIDHFSRHGVNLVDPIVSVLANVRAQTCGGFGFAVNVGTSLTFLSCYANGCHSGGFVLDSSSYSTLVSCAVDSTTGNAYEVTNCNGAVLHGCGCEDIGVTGYRISGGTTCTVDSCYSSGNDEVAYKVTNSAAKALLLNVRERNPDVGATASVQVDAGASATVIQAAVTTATNYASGTTRVLDGGILDVASPGTSINGVSRGAVTNFAAYVLRTAGVDRWALQMVNDSTNDVRLSDSANGTTALLAENRGTAPNLSLLTSTKSYGGGVGVVFLPNASTNPSTNPAGGGVLYAEGGSLKFRGSSGTVTTIAPA